MRNITAKLILLLTLISTSIFAQVDCEKYPDKYVPIDLDDALNYLDCKWSESDKDGFKNKPENEAVTELHLGLEWVFETVGDYGKEILELQNISET